LGIVGKGRAGRQGVGRNGTERVRERWKGAGGRGRGRERNGGLR